MRLIGLIIFSFCIIILFSSIVLADDKDYLSVDSHGCFEVKWKGHVGVVKQKYDVEIQELCGRNRYIYPYVVVDQFSIDPNKIDIKIKKLELKYVEVNSTRPEYSNITYNYSANDLLPPVLYPDDLRLHPNCVDNGDNQTFSCSIVEYVPVVEMVEKEIEHDINYTIMRYDNVVMAYIEEPLYVKANGKIKLKVEVKFKHAVEKDKKWSGGRVGIVIDGHLYHPWWNTSWSYRKMINLKDYYSNINWDSAPQVGIKNYIINISRLNGMNPDYSDIRLTAINEYLDEEEIPFIFLNKTNDYALIYAKIYPSHSGFAPYPYNENNDLVVYLYYGNPSPPPTTYSVSDVKPNDYYYWLQISSSFNLRPVSARSYNNEVVSTYIYSSGVTVTVLWKKLNSTSLVTGSYNINAVCYPLGYMMGNSFIDDNYIYLAFSVRVCGVWKGYVLKVNKYDFSNATLVFIGNNKYLYDIVGDGNYIYVVGRLGSNAFIQKLYKQNLTSVLENTIQLSTAINYLYYPIDQNSLCFFAYAYENASYYDVRYVCFDSELNITVNKYLFSNVKLNDVEHYDFVYALLENSTIYVYDISGNLNKSYSLPCVGYDMNVEGDLIFAKCSGSTLYIHNNDIVSVPTNLISNRIGKFSVKFDRNNLRFYLVSLEYRSSPIDYLFTTYTRTRLDAQFIPSIEWYDAIPIWVYNNNSINYTNVVISVEMNRSAGMSQNYSDILVTTPEGGYWMYIPHYIESYNSTHFNITIYLGNVSAYENRSLMLRFNKSIDYTPYFINHPYFTYPLYVGIYNGLFYSKGINGILSYGNPPRIVFRNSNPATTMEFEPPLYLRMDGLIADDYKTIVEVRNSTNDLVYKIEFSSSPSWYPIPFKLYDSQSNVLCQHTTSLALPLIIEINDSGYLIAKEGQYSCVAPINKFDKYHFVFRTYYWYNGITKMYGYSYLPNYAFDPPQKSNYAVDIETLNQPPEIYVYSPIKYSYYNEPILSFKVVDDLSDSMVVSIMLDNSTIYENNNYTNDTLEIINLTNYINTSNVELHVVQIYANDGTSYVYSDDIPFYYAPFKFSIITNGDFVPRGVAQEINLSTTLVNTTEFIIEHWYSDFSTTYPKTNVSLTPTCINFTCNATYSIPCVENSFVYFNAYVSNGTDIFKSGPISYICGGLPLAQGDKILTPYPVAGGLAPNTELVVKSFAATVSYGDCVKDVIVAELKHDWFTYDATLDIIDIPKNMIDYDRNIKIQPGTNLINVTVCGVDAGDYAGRIVITLENGISDSAQIGIHVRVFQQTLIGMIKNNWILIILVILAIHYIRSERR